MFYFKSRYGYEPLCTHSRRFKLKEIAANATPCGYWLSFLFFAFILFYFYRFYSCNSGKSISRTEATRETPPSPPRYSQGGVVESFYFAIKARLRLGQNKNWCCSVSLRIAFLFLNFIVFFYVIQFSTFIFLSTRQSCRSTPQRKPYTPIQLFVEEFLTSFFCFRFHLRTKQRCCIFWLSLVVNCINNFPFSSSDKG